MFNGFLLQYRCQHIRLHYFNNLYIFFTMSYYDLHLLLRVSSNSIEYIECITFVLLLTCSNSFMNPLALYADLPYTCHLASQIISSQIPTLKGLQDTKVKDAHLQATRKRHTGPSLEFMEGQMPCRNDT
jgi:hypothetical protein